LEVVFGKNSSLGQSVEIKDYEENEEMALEGCSEQ